MWTAEEYRHVLTGKNIILQPAPLRGTSSRGNGDRSGASVSENTGTMFIEAEMDIEENAVSRRIQTKA